MHVSPTVVHTWSQKASNLTQSVWDHFWGIGDLLRGSNILFEICRELDVDYELDISPHPIGSLFAVESSTSEKPAVSAPFYHFESYDHGKRLVHSLLQTCDRIAINTNGGPSWPAHTSSHWQESIKRILRPTPQFEEYLSRRIPTTPYEVIHFRLGDRGLVRKRSVTMEEAIDWFIKTKHPDKIVLSDSEQLKAAIRSLAPDIRISDAKPVHTGRAKSGDALMETVGDFLLISRAKRVETYSVYPWVSGFVVAASRIYGVPYQSVTLAPEKIPPTLIATNRVVKFLRVGWVPAALRRIHLGWIPDALRRLIS